ncbi:MULTISPECIES: ubiquinone biosynthesis methyltransferase UbiE [unclassified Mesorhizobium]|uniref:ubiquinone biosynthesis methyltransferase UbiE n=1 Tax=unclassified Mesorhizobium TaxID=325217 RepID=UPI000F74EF11|nr:MULTISPECIES: ubiquinone biosynthesis methyltransferase UbiE [unclassified Mesorhizobium]AZO07495.1 ubiquinone biosynthesis methyltransferase UbiE [Mesorhizobium sp. M2A.F.Ca.ET.043.02.1.1]RWB43015.1 MAG: ubiquinone biosynthesis methyltransferase UbiE [Mesorhizobium sp.]RWB65030.1 MAG: ubiquinone biosynthesis methyltransferase UbiE [Mesorhizobium sp.]RWB88238.1 MAG: ubiquinone biosynthesis methyltransferase UbiE [Mesorhizobium sp.]RWD77439.1 MAG: ubiquinone biosynthesis methyltransferase Ub
MGSVRNEPAGEPTFKPMIQIDMEIKTFVSAWKHCDYVSTYMARMISQNRSDSVRHSNLFSSAFNELLEVAFRTRHTDGELACRVSRHGATDRIELTIPCVPEERQFYQEAVSHAAGFEAGERYLNSVSGDLAPSREVVLLELAVDYNATLSVEEAESDAIKLVVDLPLEGLQH